MHAQVEIGVAQAKAMGEAMAAMDFKLYGTPETAQQILRMIGLADGVGSLINTAPAPLKELGNRLINRVLPANGNGDAEKSASNDNGLNLTAAQPVLREAALIASQYLSADELQTLTVGAALEQVLGVASEEQQAVLHKVQGMLQLMPQLADQPLSSVLMLVQNS